VAERPASPAFPLTADLAGVLAIARQERAEAAGRFFVGLARAVTRIGRRCAAKPLDSVAPVR